MTRESTHPALKGGFLALLAAVLFGLSCYRRFKFDPLGMRVEFFEQILFGFLFKVCRLPNQTQNVSPPSPSTARHAAAALCSRWAVPSL